MPPDEEPELRESPLPAADDQRIRRLLADARHTEALPPALAARLDGVLADLVADRQAQYVAPRTPGSDETPVADLAVRRRRRTAAQLLVAAAAVIALGVGVSRVLPQGTEGQAGTTADQPAADSALEEGGGSGDAGGIGASPEDIPSEAAAVKIRAERFGADVRNVRARLVRGDLDALLRTAKTFRAEGCAPADLGPGAVLPATYDGAPAVLVVRAPSGDVQVVDLYLCDDTEPRRSITLPVP
jgi:hypothetical protein